MTDWKLECDRVRLAVTRNGAHVGPVLFRLGKRWADVMSVSPWRAEPLPPEVPQILRQLRGDFFCLPFGRNKAPHLGQRHPVHGESANLPWTRLRGKSPHATPPTIQAGAKSLDLELNTRVVKGHIHKRITLLPGHPVVYLRHTLTGFSGAFPLGHHAMLRFDSPGLLSVGGLAFGMTTPFPVESPENSGYSALKPDRRFKSLSAVPTVFGDTVDLSRLPSKPGYDDVVQLVTRPTSGPGWAAVAFPEQRYAWFSVKHAHILPTTMLWLSNGGRHYTPWNGRHRNVVGVEDVCSYFHYGLHDSASPNPLAAAGVPTTLRLSPTEPTVIPYAFGMVELPRGFTTVARLDLDAHSDTLTLADPHGHTASVPFHAAHFATPVPPGLRPATPRQSNPPARRSSSR